jgi:hypothetical protein
MDMALRFVLWLVLIVSFFCWGCRFIILGSGLGIRRRVGGLFIVLDCAYFLVLVVL